jgi:hypothetical protein
MKLSGSTEQIRCSGVGYFVFRIWAANKKALREG